VTNNARASAIEIAEAVRSGERRAVDVLEECLAAIDRFNPELNAFVHLDPEGARRVAVSVDESVAAGAIRVRWPGSPSG
jgi:Asp-tRNA(Asn)/Glu-tRNA(Gln) amidotransferase A subunit family amidase